LNQRREESGGARGKMPWLPRHTDGREPGIILLTLISGDGFFITEESQRFFAQQGKKMSDDVDREEVVAAVDHLVEELLEKAQWEAPPVDAIALAQRHLGMLICLDRRQPQRGRAQRAAGSRQIFLRPEPTEERHQWTVAHEIGEHFKSAL